MDRHSGPGQSHWREFSAGLSNDALWNECAFEPIADGWRKPDLRSDRTGDVAVSHAVMPPMQIRLFGDRQPDPYYQVVRVSEESLLQIDGRDPLRLVPDELVVITSRMRGTWTIERPYTTTSLHVERALFVQEIPCATDLIGRRLRLPFELGEALHRMIDLGLAMAGTSRFRDDAGRLTASFMQIMAMMPSQAVPVGGARRSGLEYRREQIKAYIRRNFDDHELTIEAVARRLNLTARYIQMVFAGEDVGPSEFLRRCRLDAAARRLVGNDAGEATITQVAFDCGFGSSAHFSNEFRRHFGVGPREYRRRH